MNCSTLVRVDVPTVPKPRTRIGEARGRRLVKDRSGALCEICGKNPAKHWHHRQSTDDGGTWAPSNGMHICIACRRRVADRKPHYYLVGWCVREDCDPALVPVAINHGAHVGLYLLTDDGEYDEAYPTALDEAS
jgi:hypothetical protein